jgi:repressor LexA
MKESLNKQESEALRAIRNFLMHKGRFPTIRELRDDLKYKSSRSAHLLINQLVEKGALRKKSAGGLQIIDIKKDELLHARTVDIPLVGEVACGSPILAQENIEATIQVSTKLAPPPYKYFILRAKGNSMNEKGIANRDLVLIRQQASANNGDTVVALIDDEATIKEFHRHGNTIVLKPRSTDKIHQPIILTEDFNIQGIVVTTIPNF